MQYFPSSWYIWTLSSSGKLLVGTLVVTGLLVGYWIAKRPRLLSVAWLPGCGVAGLAIVGQVLTAQILAIDPHRDLGRVPLSPVLAWLASVGAVVLSFGAPLMVGVAAGLVVFARNRAARAWAAALALCTVYSMWLAPWILYVVAD